MLCAIIDLMVFYVCIDKLFAVDLAGEESRVVDDLFGELFVVEGLDLLLGDLEFIWYLGIT